MEKSHLFPAPIAHRSNKNLRPQIRSWVPGFRVILLHDSARSSSGSGRPSKAELVDKARGR